ncbi:hypothetical protein [Vibrio phage phiKT1028]|nr:hypothetical protein [Vibrio phage phiKT1028]
MEVNHYVRDWLTNNDRDMCCAEFFIRTDYNGKFYTMGYSIKNRNLCSVFLMADRGQEVLPEEYRYHNAHIADLITTLDRVHDLLCKYSESPYAPRHWCVGHIDVYNSVNISLQSRVAGRHQLLFQIGTKTTHFNLSTKSMIDVIFSLMDMAKDHKRKLEGLIVHEESK